MGEPLISVVTPTFNQGAYIRETLASVARQTYKNFEHIIVDGGSTDETIAIVKEYQANNPRITFISERDFGQADALNKALRLAKGDIIAWINSDDLYEPTAFEHAVAALQDSAVAMGRCLVFEDGKGPLYVVSNYGRTWFDLLKYWIAYSIPTQPAIFFRRSILEGLAHNKLEGSPTEYVDPNLHYVMDYDLWLRMAALYPFTKRIDATTSHYRFTETNKTSPNRPLLSYAGAEMNTVFQRAEAMAGSARQVSFIIYASEPSDALSNTVASLLEDRKIDFEIVLAMPRVTTAMRKFIEEINAQQEAAKNYRFIFPIASARPGILGVISDAIERCAGRIITVLPVGALAAPDLAEQLVVAFQDNRLGVILPFAKNDKIIKQFTSENIEHPEHADFLFTKFLFGNIPNFSFTFALRRLAWLEGPGIRTTGSHPLRELKRLVVTRIRQGWHARMNSPCIVTFPAHDGGVSNSSTGPTSELFLQLLGAELICEAVALAKTDPFCNLRRGYRLCYRIEGESETKTAELLAKAPDNWTLGL